MSGNHPSQLSPRQRMINMMYLVLTALLALNVSKEVLNSFFEVNLGIIKTTESLLEKSSSKYVALEKFNNKVKSDPYLTLTRQIKPEVDNLTLYIQEMKYDLVSRADGGKVYLGDYIIGGKKEENVQWLVKPEGSKFSELSNEQKHTKISNLNNKSVRDASGYLFNPENKSNKELVDGKGRATILKEKIKEYKFFLLDILKQAEQTCDGVSVLDIKYQSLVSEINKILEIKETDENGKHQYGTRGKKVTWEHHNFHDMPAVSALTLLTKWQADVRNVESLVVSYLANSVGAEDLKFTTAEGTVIPSSNFILKGQKFSAQIFLSAFDEDQKPEIYIGNYTTDVDDKGTADPNDNDTIFIPANGTFLNNNKIINGKGLYEVTTSGTGEKTLKGFIKIKQEKSDKYYKFEKNYVVAPKSFSVSPTNMNVLYCDGVENPISVSVAGYQAKDINISFSEGTKKSTGKGTWKLTVHNKYKKKKVQVKVSVKSRSGKTITMGNYEFRVKGLPPAVVYDNIKGAKKNKNILGRSEIFQMSLSSNRGENWDFPGKQKVVSFRCMVQADGLPKTFRCDGNKFSSKAKKEINMLETGQTVTVNNIRVREMKTGRAETSEKTFTYFIK